MSDREFTLTTLLDPIQPEAFFQETWEKQPLLVRREKPDYYAGLLSLEDIDDLLYFTRPESWIAQTEKAEPEYPGTEAPPLGMKRVHSWLGVPNLLELCQEYGQGQTIIAYRLQHCRRSVALLSRNLAGAFQHPVNVSMWLTPPASQSFEPHFDTHDFFILQLEGTKHWRLYGGGPTLPLSEDRARMARSDLGPVQEIELRPGDLLYLPRGHVHEPFTGESLSLHLTVGIFVYRWADLFEQALQAVVQQDVRFREAVPRGYLDSAAAAADLQTRFQELLQGFAAGASVAQASARLADRFFAEHLPALPDGRLTGPEARATIELDTVLEKRPGSVCRVSAGAESAQIQFPGNRVSGPSWIAPALHFVAQAARFAVRGLPDDLSDNAKVVLARRLVREGLLRIV